MLERSDFEKVGRLLEDFKPRNTFYEKSILIPSVRDRIQYTLVLFEYFKSVCKNTNAARDIDGPLRNLLDPRLFDLGAPEPKVGEQYLDEVSKQCDSNFIEPGKALLEELSKPEVLTDHEKTAAVLNSAANHFRAIVAADQRLFLFAYRSILSVKHLATGEMVAGPPVELGIVLLPFELRLRELVTVASSTVETIEAWGVQIRAQKARHIDLIVSLSQTKASEMQAKSARYNIWFQIAVVVFTVALVFLAERANLYIEKRDLEKLVQKLEEKSLSSEGELQSLRGDKERLSKQVSQLSSENFAMKEQLKKFSQEDSETRSQKKK